MCRQLSCSPECCHPLNLLHVNCSYGHLVVYCWPLKHCPVNCVVAFGGFTVTVLDSVVTVVEMSGTGGVVVFGCCVSLVAKKVLTVPLLMFGEGVRH